MDILTPLLKRLQVEMGTVSSDSITGMVMDLRLTKVRMRAGSPCLWFCGIKPKTNKKSDPSAFEDCCLVAMLCTVGKAGFM